MDPKACSIETVLHSTTFLEENDKWRGAAEIVQRDVTFPEGNTKRFVDVRLRVGNRWLVLPRGGLQEIVQALNKTTLVIDKLERPEVTRVQPVPEAENEFPKRRRIVDADRRGRKRSRYEENEE